MLQLARTRHRALYQWKQPRFLINTRSVTQKVAYDTSAQISSAMGESTILRTVRVSGLRRTWHQPANDYTLTKYRAAALAAGACGTLGYLEDQKPTACASTKGTDDEDPLEKTKKKVQEIFTIALAQLAALLPDDCSTLKRKVDEVLAAGQGGQISWGFCTGACAGFALKKVSKLGTMAMGALFVLLHCACFSGYVNVDYKKLESDVKRYLDINQDGGFETKDLDYMYQSVMKVLKSGMPAGSGFAVGFVMGFRSG